jgi:hypothetical protein
VAQGVPPRRSARMPAGSRRGPSDEQRRRGRPERGSPAPSRYADAFDDQGDEDLPPWAGPGIYPTGPGGKQRRPLRADEYEGPADPGSGDGSGRPDADGAWPAGELPRSRRSRRAAAARARKSRLRLILAGVVIVAGALAVLGILGKLPFQGTSAPPQNSGLVTTFQRGEFRSVPNTCDAVGAATLSQYLPGKVQQVSQALGTSTQSQCTWTLDARPDFRVLTVTSQAYTPSLLASGDGSATSSAIDAYGQELLSLQNPGKKTKAPKAQIGGAVGLGSDAFTAFQVFHAGGNITDEVTAVARDHNVLIIVAMQGQEHGGGFGPVPDATLRAAALAVAHEVLAGLH